MSTAFSADISGQRIEVKIEAKKYYGPPVLSIQQGNGVFQLQADDDQLAEVAYALWDYLNRIKHPLPKQLAVEAKEEIA
ncbi:hypothetical protein [Paenibacillus apii]|uniref:hypothetical protein n=1 Tax=Paenibacillus apii TaxID=1850370 RepID=UPI00143BC4EC|nr:hypothetical protein [Paenibacillus apii]NJJ37864.1 hypothetical protein [Paenibacillus apii]